MKKQILTVIVAAGLVTGTAKCNVAENLLKTAAERPGQTMLIAGALLAAPVYFATEYGVKPLATGVEKVAHFLKRPAGQTTVAYGLGCLTSFFVMNFLQTLGKNA